MTDRSGTETDRWQRRLQRFLQLVGGVSLLAFAAALMPEDWFIKISEELGQTFAPEPLTFYLARHLSLMYGFVALVLLILAVDVARYVPLIRLAGYGTGLMGVLQGTIDHFSDLPVWWTLLESLSTLAGGVILIVLARKAGQESDRHQEPST